MEKYSIENVSSISLIQLNEELQSVQNALCIIQADMRKLLEEPKVRQYAELNKKFQELSAYMNRLQYLKEILRDEAINDAVKRSGTRF